MFCLQRVTSLCNWAFKLGRENRSIALTNNNNKTWIYLAHSVKKTFNALTTLVKTKQKPFKAARVTHTLQDACRASTPECSLHTIIYSLRTTRWNRDPVLFSAENLQYLWNGARYDQGYYWWLIGSRIRAFDWCQNQRPWMILNGHYALCFNIHAFSELTTKIWMKIDSHDRGKDVAPCCSFWQYKVYADTRGVSWRRGVNRQWGCWKRQFSVFSLTVSQNL